MYSVYKITCKDPEVKEVYVGITKDMRKREIAHKTCCKSKERKVYHFIRDHGDWKNWDMIVIEETDDMNRERYWIEELGASLNDVVPGRTLEEWYQDNKDKKREYREANKDKIKDIISQKITCDCGTIHTRNSKARHLRTQKTSRLP